MSIRPLPIEDSELARQLLTLQRASYQLEASLIGFDAIPALTETLTELQNCGETCYGYWLEGELVGAIAYKKAGLTLDIYRLVVHPSRLRRGIGRALLRFVENREKEQARLIVSTGRDNLPARHLYLSEGFLPVHDEEVVPGLYITHFEKLSQPA